MIGGCSARDFTKISPPKLDFQFFRFLGFLDPPTVILWFDKWRFWKKIAIFHHFLEFLTSKRRGNFFLTLVTDQKWVCGSFNAIIVQIGRKKKKLHRFSCFLSSLGFRSKISPKIGEKWHFFQDTAEELKNPENLICELGKFFKTKWAGESDAKLRKMFPALSEIEKKKILAPNFFFTLKWLCF